MKNHKEEPYVDFKIRDSTGKKMDEGYMSISKCISHWKKLLKKKYK